jgi:PEP-CTERM motif-containing protein
MRISRQMLGIAAASVFGITAQASAQAVEFHGSVQGCFTTGATCVPAPVDFNVSAFGNVKYNSDSFDNTTLGGAAGFGNGAGAGSFGKVTVSGSDYTAPAGLKLILTFFFNPLADPLCGCTSTPDVTGGQPFSAQVTGEVNTTAGDLNVSFPAGGIDFAFTNGGTTGGGFTHSGVAHLTVNNIDLTNTSLSPSLNLSGRITTRITDTPEPATVALFATGLVGLIPVARRRAKNRA